jgi:hypothetical protein
METLNARTSLREERQVLRNEDGGSDSRTDHRLTKTTAPEERRRFGKKDGHPKLKDGPPGRKTAARETKTPAVQQKNGPSKQNGRPNGEARAGTRKTALSSFAADFWS